MANVDGIDQVFIQDPSGTSVQASSVTEERYHAQALAWSPDGEWLAYARGTYEVWLVRRDGSDEHFLIPGHSPRWTPDGRGIVVSTPGNPEIDVDVVRHDAVLVGITDGDAAGAAEQIGISREVWTPDGLRFLEGMDRASPQLNDPATGARIPLLAASEVAWSPDFRRLAFVRAGACGTSMCPVVGLAGPDGSEPMDVAPGWNPVWSPDGRFVAFLDGPLPGNVSFLQLMTATGELVPAPEQVALDLAWTPDSRALAVVVGPDLPLDILLYHRHDGTTVRLASGSAPSFSP